MVMTDAVAGCRHEFGVYAALGAAPLRLMASSCVDPRAKLRWAWRLGLRLRWRVRGFWSAFCSESARCTRRHRDWVPLFLGIGGAARKPCLHLPRRTGGACAGA